MASATDTTVHSLERRFGVIGKEPANCETHGDYIASIREGGERSMCPVCREIERDKQEAENRRLDFIERNLPRARIPKRFAGKGFETYIAKNPGQVKAAETCTAYADDFPKHRRDGRCLLLLGKLGTGKTHLATAIASWLICEQQYRAMYRTVGDILADIRASYSGEESEAEVFKPLLSVDLLVLDEVGATKSSEFELATLYRIINHRYERCLPMIIVSNLAAGELGNAIGERCLDRIRENGAIVVPFNWESARKGITQ